jgi:hypothetical protein
VSVSKQTGRFPCTALLKDGSPCGRYYKKGDPEPFCSVHRKDFKPTGAAVPRPKPVSHVERLRRFAESSDPRVAMAAIAALDRRSSDDKQTPSGISARALLDAMTPEEREQAAVIVGQYRELQRAVYRRRPDLPRPDGLFAAEVVVAPGPTEEAPSTEATAPDEEEAPTPPVVEDDDDGWEEI